MRGLGERAPGRLHLLHSGTRRQTEHGEGIERRALTIRMPPTSGHTVTLTGTVTLIGSEQNVPGGVVERKQDFHLTLRDPNTPGQSRLAEKGG